MAYKLDQNTHLKTSALQRDNVPQNLLGTTQKMEAVKMVLWIHRIRMGLLEMTLLEMDGILMKHLFLMVAISSTSLF